MSQVVYNQIGEVMARENAQRLSQNVQETLDLLVKKVDALSEQVAALQTKKLKQSE